MSGLSNGFAQLFKGWGKGIGNALDNVWLRADAQKAIRDEVGKKFQPVIERALIGEGRKAKNIKELDKKLAESKDNWQTARDKWNEEYNKALADAKNQRQIEINDYDAKLKGYQGALDNANTARQDIVDQLNNLEAKYNPNSTIFIDVKTGKRYIVDPLSGEYKTLEAYRKSLDKKGKRDFDNRIGNYEQRLFNENSGKVINAFDESNKNLYGGYSPFDNYLGMREGQNATLLRDLKNADTNISKANADLTGWQTKGQPAKWDDVADSKKFKTDYKKTNSVPTKYDFNGQTYKDAKDLEAAYQKALASEEKGEQIYKGRLSKFTSARDKEIAQRIQDAKDMNKAKVALGGTLGAGALYAGARAMYGGDDTDTDNTNNTDIGKPDPNINIANTPEGQALLNDEQSDTAPIDTGFDPDKADALASAAYAKGVEDGNSVESSGDLGNNIAASTGGHTIDDGLFELLKAMQDPHKADAVANYIYSRHGDDPDVQRLGWRAWLNKYYGDSLRSMMNIDPSGYNGMHVSGGL